MYCVWQINKEIDNQINNIDAEINECIALKQNIEEYIAISSQISSYTDCCYGNIQLGLSGEAFKNSFDNIGDYNKTLEAERKKLWNSVTEIETKIASLNEEKAALMPLKLEKVCYDTSDSMTV